MSNSLSSELASRFARTALGHVAREWPNKLDHVLSGPEDVRGPARPASGFLWQLRLAFLRSRPLASGTAVSALSEVIEVAAEIRAFLDGQFTPANVEGEVAYLRNPASRGFERPYGWAWLLMLAGELARHKTEEGRRWSETLKPLADMFVGAIPVLPADCDLSRARGRPFQHGVRDGAGARLCCGRQRCAAGAAMFREGARLVCARCGLPGLGAVAGRVSVAPR